MTSKSQQTVFDRIKDYGTIVALLASLATLIAVVVQLSPKSAELTINVRNIENLTRLPGIPQLEGRFLFKGDEVKDLLSVRLQLSNTGNVTIIGKGNKKNIIGDSIGFDLPEYLSVLEIVQGGGSFNYQIENTNRRSVGVRFEQWRPGEDISVVLYVEGVNREGRPVVITPRGRDLVDGELVILDQSVSDQVKVNPVREKLGQTTASILKAITGVTLFVTILIYAMLMIEPFKEYRKRKKWMQTFGAKFNAYVDSLKQLDQEQKKNIKKNPKLLSRVLWVPFEGPEIEGANFSQNGSQVLMFSAFFFLLLIGSINMVVGWHLY